MSDRDCLWSGYIIVNSNLCMFCFAKLVPWGIDLSLMQPRAFWDLVTLHFDPDSSLSHPDDVCVPRGIFIPYEPDTWAGSALHSHAIPPCFILYPLLCSGWKTVKCACLVVHLWCYITCVLSLKINLGSKVNISISNCRYVQTSSSSAAAAAAAFI